MSFYLFFNIFSEYFIFLTELKCLQVILNDETKSKALEDDCREKLQQRIEMFNNAAAVRYLFLLVKPLT